MQEAAKRYGDTVILTVPNDLWSLVQPRLGKDEFSELVEDPTQRFTILFRSALARRDLSRR